VRLRWKASGALTIKLYQENTEINDRVFRPSDEYETSITQSTIFKLVVDYGNEEIVEKETKASIIIYGTGTYGTGGTSSPGVAEPGSLFAVKPETFNAEGTYNSVFTQLADFIKDNQAEGIELLEISVAEVMDYRKLLTAFPLLMKLPLQIDQTASITLGEQFIRLEYQGPYKGFNSFQNTLNTLLGSKDVKADVFLKLEFKFLSPILPEGTEISNIKSTLNRNPVDRLNLMAKVTY
jgi:hypothetical protein